MSYQGEKYWNPYLAGIALGLVLLTAYVVMGRGIGASGAFTSVVAFGVQTAAPRHAASNGLYAEYLGDGTTSPLKDWLVFEMMGVILGGFVSGFLAGRVHAGVEHGPRISSSGRLLLAVLGGGIMGIGTKFARGCTSGQALTGGALLSVGSWAFMIMVFVGAYGGAYFLRREWT